MQRTRKIMHLSTVHPSSDTRIFHREVKSLAEAGYDVVLLAQESIRKQPYMAQPNNIKVYTLPKPRNRLHRVIGFPLKALKLAIKENADIYHFHDPELIPVGLFLRLLGKKVIYDVHEDFPRQILSKYWIPFFLRSIIAKLAALMEWIAGRLMSGIVVANPGTAKRFPLQKTIVLQNFPLLSEFVTTSSRPYDERPMRVAYVGGISLIRGAAVMVRAMELLPEHLQTQLVLVGTFSPPQLKESLQKLKGWKYVNFVGWQDRRNISRILESTRIGLVVLQPVPNYLNNYPVKLFEYMAAGIPVVASDFPHLKEIIAGVGCGLTVEPSNPEAVAEGIRWLLEHPNEAREMGRRGRKAVLEKYNWDKESEKLLGLYQKLL